MLKPQGVAGVPTSVRVLVKNDVGRSRSRRQATSRVEGRFRVFWDDKVIAWRDVIFDYFPALNAKFGIVSQGSATSLNLVVRQNGDSEGMAAEEEERIRASMFSDEAVKIWL